MTLKFLLPVCAILVLAAWIGPVPTQSNHPKIAFRTVSVDGLTLFYREAGDPSKPAILLLHGFPSTSHMYGNLMTDLADRYHLIAPDYPGFGNSSLPAPDAFAYSFDHLATVMNDFIQALNLKKIALYMQDYGGPVGFRLASEHPENISALIIQNANAYNEGLGEGFSKIMKMQQAGDRKGVDAILRHIISFDGIKEQYIGGAGDATHIPPEAWLTDLFYIQRPGVADIQSALFYDYHNNLDKYSQWQRYFQDHQPPALILWGQNDPIFTAPGANAYSKDLPNAEVHLLNGGHFALVEYSSEMAGYIKAFLSEKGIK